MAPKSGHFTGFSGAGWGESGAVQGVFWGWGRGDPPAPLSAKVGVPPHGSNAMILHFVWSLRRSGCAGNGRRGGGRVGGTPHPSFVHEGVVPWWQKGFRMAPEIRAVLWITFREFENHDISFTLLGSIQYPIMVER